MTKHKVADEPEKHYTSIQQSAGEPFTHRHLQHCLWCGLPLRDVTSDQTHTRTHTVSRGTDRAHTDRHTLPDTLLLNLLGGGAGKETERERVNIILYENLIPEYKKNKYLIRKHKLWFKSF